MQAAMPPIIRIMGLATITIGQGTTTTGLDIIITGLATITIGRGTITTGRLWGRPTCPNTCLAILHPISFIQAHP